MTLFQFQIKELENKFEKSANQLAEFIKLSIEHNKEVYKRIKDLEIIMGAIIQTPELAKLIKKTIDKSDDQT